MKLTASIFLTLVALSLSGVSIAGDFASKHRHANNGHHLDFQWTHGNDGINRHYRSDHNRHKAFKHRGYHHKQNRQYYKNRQHHNYFGFSYFRYYDEPRHFRGDRYSYRLNHRHHSNCRH